jgi:hypothetical protein
MFPTPKVVPERLARAYARRHPTPIGRTGTTGGHCVGNCDANGRIVCAPLGDGWGRAEQERNKQ